MNAEVVEMSQLPAWERKRIRRLPAVNHFDSNLLCQLLDVVLEALTERQRDALCYLFGVGGHQVLTQTQVATQLGLSPSRIARLKIVALKRAAELTDSQTRQLVLESLGCSESVVPAAEQESREQPTVAKKPISYSWGKMRAAQQSLALCAKCGVAWVQRVAESELWYCTRCIEAERRRARNSYKQCTTCGRHFRPGERASPGTGPPGCYITPEWPAGLMCCAWCVPQQMRMT
jgi:hypothetical protein